jgi:recombination protein RecA
MTDTESTAVAKTESKTKARTGPSTKTPLKKVAKMKAGAQKAASAASIKSAELAAKTIAKFTNQKPIGFNEHPLPCVSTGPMGLDYLIGGILAPDKSGPLCPGYPRGHITELYGPEASGKTTLALEAIVETQRRGGSAMFLDFEHALAHRYAKDLGVDFNPQRLLLYQPDNMEQGLDMLRLGLATGIDLIVVDSVAAMVPKSEMEKNFEDPNKIGVVALKLAQSLPKVVKFLKPHERNPQGTALIFINQTRAQISTGPGPARGGGGDNTAGGKALKFYAYLRLQTTCIRTERLKMRDPMSQKEKNVPFGSHTQVKVVKSKVDAKQGQTADLFIRYGQGIDDVYSTIESGVAWRIIKKGGAIFEYAGQKFQGRERLRAFLINDPTAFETLQAAVLEAIRSQAMPDPESEPTEEDEVDSILATSFGSGDEEDDVEGVPEEVELEEEV